jgi:DNA-binding cell septation regulator SpoVG
MDDYKNLRRTAKMPPVKITNVNVTIRSRGDVKDANVLGFAEVVIDNSLAIRNIKILRAKNKNGKLLSFPAQMARESKKWYDVCYPINQETREYFEKVIFNAYDKLLEAQPQE